MFSQKVIITNHAGIHVRPSTIILQESGGYEGDITLKANGMEIQLNNPAAALGLLAMGLKENDEVKINVSGPDETEKGQKLAELFSRDFDFPS